MEKPWKWKKRGNFPKHFVIKLSSTVDNLASLAAGTYTFRQDNIIMESSRGLWNSTEGRSGVTEVYEASDKAGDVAAVLGSAIQHSIPR